MKRKAGQPPSSDFFRFRACAVSLLAPASQVEGPPDFGPVGGAELRSDVTNVVVAPVGSVEINPEEAGHGSPKSGCLCIMSTSLQTCSMP